MSIKIFFSEISCETNFRIFELMKFVSHEKKEKLIKFKFDIDRKLSLYSELLVRYQACKELNLLNKEIVFAKNKNGKPFLLDHPEFQFNISHTRNAIAVAFLNREIGIDIESIKPCDLTIAKRFFTSSEQNYIFSHDNPDDAFYEIWTKKEAYIKYLGTGLSTPLKSFDVMDDKTRPILHTDTAKKYMISTCYKRGSASAPKITNLSETELLGLIHTITK